MNAKLFSYPVLIKESYLDTFGHVNNATYLSLLEEARWDFITKNGYGLKKIHELGIGPTILEVHLNFIKEIRLRELITIQTQIISYEKKICKISQKMIREDVLCCSAEIVMGLFSLSERKLILPTAEWLAAIGIET